ncbi:type I-F CRISPR-associated endoribonuclease Cas6/Csy4 [Pontibacterium sp.]|uniref:type I-F CRISPR-associated endoribonuclease Cas6/Csy4 n=1 Tax=Pontibacterium sp. TaxID=2036026 RepID=UPI0035126FFE
MLTHYIEIRVRPDPEFSESMLLGALFSKLHRALADLQSNSIGVSFPQYSLKPKTLGNTLRIHADPAMLDKLSNTGWLRGMRDHVQINEMMPIPETAEYRTLSRKQFKTNVERLRRRRMKRKGESYEETCAHIPDTVERRSDLPFICLRSQSNGNTFLQFIELGTPQAEPIPGQFNTYGLSTTATVPWF